MEKIGFIIIPVGGLSSSLLAWSYAGGGLYGVLVICACAASSACALLFYNMRRVKADTTWREVKGVFSVLKRTSSLMERFRFDKSLELALAGNREVYANHIFYGMLCDMRSGVSYNEALRMRIGRANSKSTSGMEALENIGSCGSGSPSKGRIIAELGRLEQKNRRELERRAGETLRYTTAYMVAGTVVPSLLILGFVGYSVLSFSEAAVLGLLCSMTILVPSILYVIGSRIGEINEGF